MLSTTVDAARLDLALLVLRLVFGLFLAYHGYNKVASGIAGTEGWFRSIGFKWPGVQARLAAATEMGAGVMFAAGLLTSFAAAGMIGVMVVAIVVAHWKVGFFIFKPNQGWEYCASIAIVALCVATVGAGQYSLDHLLSLDDTFLGEGWWGAAIAGLLGVGGAIAQLRICYRPAPATTT